MNIQLVQGQLVCRECFDKCAKKHGLIKPLKKPKSDRILGLRCVDCGDIVIFYPYICSEKGKYENTTDTSEHES